MGIIKNYQSVKSTCKVTFSYPSSAAPDVKTIQVLGDFNNWDSGLAPKMKKVKEEHSATIELKAGQTYQFRYLLDGNKWDNDFAADDYVPSPFAGIYNSVLVIDAIESQPVEKKSKKVEVQKPVNKDVAPKPKKAVAKKEVTTPKPQKEKAVEVKADDLKIIEGIGPKIAEILAAKGINTFSELSKFKPASIKSILEAAGPKFNVHDPASWPKQASLAAKGKWDELKKLQDELNAGKVKK
jgi:predicted flap endonuclease-1-like 5' DNA nuclease